MSEPAPTLEWHRLDPRMLLVHPILEVLKFLPAVIGIFIAGSFSGGQWWQYVAIAVPITLGVLRYLTTSYRISDGRIELRTGLLNKQRRSTPLARVRTVNLTATLLHRVLGLTTLKIGTGTTSLGDDELLLDGLPVERATALRADLLALRSTAPASGPSDDAAHAEPGDLPTEVPPAPEEHVLMRLDPRWARYGPFTGSGIIAWLAVVGIGTQVLTESGLGDLLPDDVGLRVAAWLLIVLAALAGLVFILVTAVVTYLVLNWDFTLTRTPESWHLRRGLFTTSETTLERSRLAGVSLKEPLFLRLVGARRLDAIATGMKAIDSTSAVLVPAAPRAAVEGVAAAVLPTEAPIRVDLVPHGPAAGRRRFIRALVPAVVLVAAVAVVVWQDLLPTWVIGPALLLPVIGLGLAVDRARSLGHAHTDGYLVARSGSLTRSRDVLATGDVIGWRFESTWFQRRVGLTSLSATTAGGDQVVTMPDVPEHLAVEVADDAVSGLVSQFLA